MTHFETEAELRRHVVEKFEALVETYGIDKIHEVISKSPYMTVRTRRDVNVTVFNPTDTDGMPRKGRKIQYRKALSHGKVMQLVGARSGSQHRLVLVFNPNVGDDLTFEDGTISLPSSMKNTSRLDIGVEVTARELIDVFEDVDFEHIHNAIKTILEEKTGVNDPRFGGGDTDEMNDTGEDPALEEEGFGAW